MTTIKIAHLADIHAKKKDAEKVFASLKMAQDECRKNDVDLIAIAGDTWDGPIQNTAGSLFPEFVEEVRKLADIAPVVMIYGTPSHDTEGSLEVFESLSCDNSITILKPGTPYFLSTFKGAQAVTWGDTGEKELVIFGVPEPQKKWLLGNSETDGKEAAEAAVRKNMRNLCLGLAASRQKFAQLPCLMLYHGQVSGARMQNDMAIESGSGIAISIDDLRAVDAQYYALGDIHQPQQVGDIQAYYSGSAYPINWGESHRAGFNLITISERTGEDLFSSRWKTEVERINFTHPENEKITIRHPKTITMEQIQNKKVWIDYRCTREEVPAIELTESRLLTMGAVTGSRVTITPDPVETVRAQAISDKKSLADKVRVWATNSGIDIRLSMVEKANLLEAEANAAGSITEGLHIRLNKLILRGAIGIWKGQDKEEICLDFDSFDSGLISLIGRNGAGKTTLIENCHPYASLLTRNDKLQDHFYLRDSYRDLYFTDEKTGIKYRSVMNINGSAKSGSIDYFLYHDKGMGFEPYPECNGRKDPYVKAIDELFGSISIFLKSAFISQRPSSLSPDLAEATKGARKALFMELAGLNHFEDYSESAKAKAKDIADNLLSDQGKICAIAEQLNELPQVRESLERGNTLILETKKSIDQVQPELSAAEKKKEEFSLLCQEMTQVKDRINQVTVQIDEHVKEIQELDQEKAVYTSALSGKEAAEESLVSIEELKGEKQRIESEYTEYLEEKSRIDTKFRDDTEVVRGNEQTLRDEKTKLERKSQEVLSKIERLDLQADHLKSEIDKPVDQNCPTCGQVFPAEKLKEYTDKINGLKADLVLLENDQATFELDKKNLIGKIETIDQKIEALDYPPELEEKPFDLSRKNEIDGELMFMDENGIRETIRKADEAKLKLENIQLRTDSLLQVKDTLEAEKTKLSASIDPDAEAKLNNSKEYLREISEKLQSLRIKEGQYEGRLNELQIQLENLLVKEIDLKNLREQVEAKRAEGTEWELLQKATSKDGIPALELDVIAPTVAEVANRLLKAAYGPRFQLEFSTVRTAGAGSKTHQVEDFLIHIYDTEKGTEQELKTLSGGESVWIKKAMYDAFGIIRAQKSGLSFLTAFQDEADGALDPEAKEHYCRMLEAAHIESGRHHTIIITHDRGIREMISQQIDITELQPAPKAEAEEVPA